MRTDRAGVGDLGGKQQHRQRFKLKAFDDTKISTAPNYLVKSILPRRGLVVVWGPPKCGKSFWTFDLVMHVAIGREYRSHKVRSGAVVYLALEGGAGFVARMEAWRRHHLTDHQDPVPFYLVDVTVNLVADHAALVAAIREQLAGQRVVAIVVDTLNRSLQGSENKDEDMAAYIRAADAVRAALDCLVIIVHHCGTAGNRPRGHTSLSGADDAQIAIERDQEGNIIATVEHMKDAEAGAVLACRLKRVELGEDSDGDPISSCVVIPAEGGAPGVKLSKAGKYAYPLLQKMMDSEGSAAPAEANLPDGARVIRVQTWRERFYALYPADKQGTKQKAFVSAHLELGPTEKALVDYWDVYVFLTPEN